MAVLEIPISKARRNISVDTNAIPKEMITRIYEEGLKVLLNSHMSKITGLAQMLNDELVKAREAASVIAEENLAKLLAGTLAKGTRGGVKSEQTGEGRAVMTEARRLAKEQVKNEIRRSKRKIAHIEPKLITQLANELVAADPTIIEMARANIEQRAGMPVAFDVSSRITVSDKLVKKATASKDNKKLKAGGKPFPQKGQRHVGATAH
jgi:hypothetical protein